MWEVQNKLFNTFNLQVTVFVSQLLLKHLMNCSRNTYSKFAILMHMKLNKEDVNHSLLRYLILSCSEMNRL
jgi:hypothetical protein